MSEILLIDDDRSLHRLLGQYLEDAGFSVLHADGGQAGLKLLFEHRPDLILLDVMMPHMDGWETCRRIRELTDVPIIFLTAKGDEPDRLQGFHLGADDYVPKPFSFPELVARVDAVLRRASHADSSRQSDDVLTCGPFRLDRARCVVTRDGQPISLTPTEYRLLEVLMSRPGAIFSQEQLVAAIWGPEYANDTGYIRRYVWHLRQKLEPDPDTPQYLLTEHGFGYRFRAG
ncbi:MAG: response regulator transcription factor [Anaerolineae bacterium]